jgi:CubicO group peptidase (beta-lactamase class C family)
MPIARDLWASKATYDTIMGRIYTIPLRKNKNFTYSCLNFCLLMDAEQHVTGIDHQTWCSTNIWEPLGAWSVCYRPLDRFKLEQIAPTEEDTYLRKQLVHGYVHDETAAFSGGLQGNAGLFANANDLAKICQMWLNGGTYGGQQILSPETVELFTTAKSPTCRRGLGFDKPDMENKRYSPTCDEANASVYGHLGFTGTVFWVDPENDLFFIFLNNRVNPTRDNQAFSSMNLRPEMFRQVLTAIK